MKDQLDKYGFIGHKNIIAQLDPLVKNPKHYTESTFLFIGPESCGKLKVAEWFAHQISDSSDVNIFTFDGSQKIDSFYEFFNSMGYQAKNLVCKTYIIDIKEPLTPLICNALLKKFEDITKSSTIILVCPSQKYIIPTISSRSRSIYFDTLTLNQAKFILMQQGFTEEQITYLINCYNSNVGLAKTMPYKDIVEAKEYIYTTFREMTAYHFVEIQELSKKMDDHFDEYLNILINWATAYMLDPQWSSRFSSLLFSLLEISNTPTLPNRNVWIERAIMKYVGWNMPKISSLYEKIN